MTDLDSTQVLQDEDLLSENFINNGDQKVIGHLEIFEDQCGSGKQLLPLFRGNNLIGREESCQVRIKFQSLSKKHAWIEENDFTYNICDLYSRNKTRKNQVILKPSVRYDLQHNDTLMFGNVTCKFIALNHFNDENASVSGSDTASESMISIIDADKNKDPDRDDSICHKVDDSATNVVTDFLVIETDSEDDGQIQPCASLAETTPDRAQSVRSCHLPVTAISESPVPETPLVGGVTCLLDSLPDANSDSIDNLSEAFAAQSQEADTQLIDQSFDLAAHMAPFAKTLPIEENTSAVDQSLVDHADVSRKSDFDAVNLDGELSQEISLNERSLKSSTMLTSTMHSFGGTPLSRITQSSSHLVSSEERVVDSQEIDCTQAYTMSPEKGLALETVQIPPQSSLPGGSPNVEHFVVIDVETCAEKDNGEVTQEADYKGAQDSGDDEYVDLFAATQDYVSAIGDCVNVNFKTHFAGETEVVLNPDTLEDKDDETVEKTSVENCKHTKKTVNSYDGDHSGSDADENIESKLMEELECSSAANENVEDDKMREPCVERVAIANKKKKKVNRRSKAVSILKQKEETTDMNVSEDDANKSNNTTNKRITRSVKKKKMSDQSLKVTDQTLNEINRGDLNGNFCRSERLKNDKTMKSVVHETPTVLCNTETSQMQQVDSEGEMKQSVSKKRSTKRSTKKTSKIINVTKDDNESVDKNKNNRVSYKLEHPRVDVKTSPKEDAGIMVNVASTIRRSLREQSSTKMYPERPKSKRALAMVCEDTLSSVLAVLETTSPDAPRIVFTGVTNKSIERTVTHLGGKVVPSVSSATHLVTDKARRTVKFLCAVCRGMPIVNMQWIEDAKAEDRFPPIEDYILVDEVAEKQFGFCLKESLSCALKSPLFEGYKVHVTKNVQPEPKAMKEIIEMAGGQFLSKAPRSFCSSTLIVSSEEDYLEAEKLKKLNFDIHNSEFVLTGVIQQKLDFGLLCASTTVSPMSRKRKQKAAKQATKGKKAK